MGVDHLTLDRDRDGRAPEAEEEAPEADKPALPRSHARRTAPPATALLIETAAVAPRAAEPPPVAKMPRSGSAPARREPEPASASPPAPSPALSDGPMPKRREPQPVPVESPDSALIRVADAFLRYRAPDDRAWSALLSASAGASAKTAASTAEALAIAIQRRSVPARRAVLEALARQERRVQMPFLAQLRVALTRIVSDPPPPPSPE